MSVAAPSRAGFLSRPGTGPGRTALLVVTALVATLGASVVEPSAAHAAVTTVSSEKPATGPLVAADVRSAQLTARIRHQRVEALSERTEISSTFVNPDGSFTSETTGLPSRIRDKHGKDGWSDVDLTLVAHPDGSVGPRVHPMGLALAGKTGSSGGLLASLTDQVGGRQVQLGWKGALPTPTLDGSRATYAGVSPAIFFGGWHGVSIDTLSQEWRNWANWSLGKFYGAHVDRGWRRVGEKEYYLRRCRNSCWEYETAHYGLAQDRIQLTVTTLWHESQRTTETPPYFTGFLGAW